RERLAGFDRPITTNPEFHGHLRDALIHDFENYLKLLKSVHSATDLETASNTVGHLLDGPARDALNFVRHQFSNPGASIIDLARSITFVRQNLASKLEHDGDTGHVREMLYLDLALEDALRMVIERSVHTGIAGEQLVGLVTAVLENVRVTSANDELGQCQREWQRLPESARFSADWALHAKATLDRLRRAVADATDFAYKELQPIADKLGMAFNADEWARKLFSEEVIRGRPAFVLSLLIRHLDPLLRRAAKLGNWQVISPSQAIGFVEVVQTLREVQSKRYGLPTVIVAEKVSGDEEPPEGVRAVITPSSVDLVSHVAVRARNAQLLFATCYDTAVFEKLKTLQSRAVRLRVTPAGDVTIDDSPGVIEENKKPRLPAPIINVRPNVSARPLRCVEFEPGLVGGKSNNLRALTETLPDWIHAPRSVALPFGAFDQMLKEAINRDVASRHRELLTKVETDPETVLPQLRDCIQQVRLPDALIAMLEKTMKAEGLSLPEDWELAARRVAQVWASKWNDRAFFSRQANRVSHHTVQMAVLIQEVVPAQYAFVIHTVNPFNNDPDEIYAEVVAGLGETLVGNHPGRALSFVADKTDRTPTVLGYPSKSIGLFGGGLIFRSDSNAEDLEGYAGAGLYDSVLLHSPREVTLDYSNDPLVWNEPFRTDVLSYIANVGLAVERAFRSPQDIEGACVEGKFFVVQTRPQVGLA
ncbi:MAG TPA: PEP/pyruvate-binding domain-containing protein, partial [Verrucomicrobiota bacterium]|nr:PEP/pyruvate-binding domain-containing protein [Verrucomicrobiota bacterium]